MQKLGWMIENEINFGNTMNFFKLQISEAISYYQSNNETISRKISITCLIRRNANITKNKKKKVKIVSKINNMLKMLQRNSNKISKFNKKLSDLFSDINKNYMSLNSFWNSLTLKSCKSLSGNPEKCWNGASISKYLKEYLKKIFLVSSKLFFY